MPTPIINPFQSFILTEEERLNGSIFHPFQKFVLQNQISEVADLLLNHRYDPQQPLEYAQRQANLHGQLESLQLLLENSDVAEQELKSINRSQEQG